MKNRFSYKNHENQKDGGCRSRPTDRADRPSPHFFVAFILIEKSIFMFVFSCIFYENPPKKEITNGYIRNNEQYTEIIINNNE